MRACVTVIGLLVGLVAVADGPLRGLDGWAGRESHLAVVNPAVPATDGSVLSLRGEWEFSELRHALEARDLRYHKAKDQTVNGDLPVTDFTKEMEL